MLRIPRYQGLKFLEMATPSRFGGFHKPPQKPSTVLTPINCFDMFRWKSQIFCPFNRKCSRNELDWSWFMSRWWFQTFFMFTPIWGRWTHFDEHIFQRGWNHQLDVVSKTATCTYLNLISASHLGQFGITGQEKAPQLLHAAEDFDRWVPNSGNTYDAKKSGESVDIHSLKLTAKAPENGWVEYYFPFGMAYFQWRTVSFREGRESLLGFIYLNCLAGFLASVLVMGFGHWNKVFVLKTWIQVHCYIDEPLSLNCTKKHRRY